MGQPPAVLDGQNNKSKCFFVGNNGIKHEISRKVVYMHDYFMHVSQPIISLETALGFVLVIDVGSGGGNSDEEKSAGNLGKKR